MASDQNTWFCSNDGDSCSTQAISITSCAHWSASNASASCFNSYVLMCTLLFNRIYSLIMRKGKKKMLFLKSIFCVCFCPFIFVGVCRGVCHQTFGHLRSEMWYSIHRTCASFQGTKRDVLKNPAGLNTPSPAELPDPSITLPAPPSPGIRAKYWKDLDFGNTSLCKWRNCMSYQ